MQVLIALLLSSVVLTAQAPSLRDALPVATPLVSGQPQTGAGGVRLLITGHLYGNPSAQDRRPALTFQRATEMLKSLRPHAVITLGDIFYKCEPAEVTRTLDVLRRLEAPIYNAPGNHDITPNVEAYRDRFGPLTGCVSIGSVLLVFLDTESTPWRLLDEQQRSILAAATALADPRIHDVLCDLERSPGVSPGQRRALPRMSHGTRPLARTVGNTRREGKRRG